MIRRHALAVGLQALGSAAAVAVVMLVAHRFGLEAQGRFALLKSWMDAAVALGMLGMPQTLLHLAYHGDVAPGRLRAHAERHAGVVLLVALAAAALAALGPAPWLAWSLLAVPGLVLHGLWRSLLLRTAGPTGYALATAAPALLLLACAACLAALGWPALGPALVLSSLLSAAAAWWMLGRAGVRREPTAGLRMPTGISWHAFAQNLCAAAQAALLLGLLSLLGASGVAVGEASVSLVVLQLFGVAAAYLAPLVYDQAARQSTAATAPNALAGRVQLSPAGLVAVLVGCAFTGWALPLLLTLALPQASTSLRLACQVMAAAGVLLLVNRVWATRLQARGGFGLLSGLAVLRLGASALALLILWPLEWPAALATAVLAAEALVLLATAARLRRPGRPA